MSERAGTLQLPKYGILVVKEIPDQAVAVPFVHGQTVFLSGAEDAGSKSVSERGDVALVGRGEFNQACEVGAESIEGSDVGKAKLAES